MFEKKRKTEGPLYVVGCSGCTRDGQMAHDLARGIAQDGFARPLCLSAIGAGYEQDITDARQAGGVIIVDGCKKECARKILEKAVGRPMMHACVLTDMDMQEKGDRNQDESMFAQQKRKIKIRYAHNRMFMSSMCDCGCGRG